MLDKVCTVIVPYNKDRGYLDQCVKSIEAQTYPHVELILSKSDNSVVYNFNRGLERATGELVKYVCEDDWLPATAIEDLVNGIGDHSWACADAFQVHRNQTTIYKPRSLSFKDMVTVNQIHGGTTIYRTWVLRHIGGMDETLWTGEEYEMHLRLYAMGLPPKYISKIVYFYRMWGGQKSKMDKKADPVKRAQEIKRIQSLYESICNSTL